MKIHHNPAVDHFPHSLLFLSSVPWFLLILLLILSSSFFPFSFSDMVFPFLIFLALYCCYCVKGHSEVNVGSSNESRKHTNFHFSCFVLYCRIGERVGMEAKEKAKWERSKVWKRNGGKVGGLQTNSYKYGEGRWWCVLALERISVPKKCLTVKGTSENIIIFFTIISELHQRDFESKRNFCSMTDKNSGNQQQ